MTTPRDAALKVAVLDALKGEVDKAYREARAEAEAVFAGIRDDGTPQQEVKLPDGTKLGLISIKAGTPEVTPDSPTALMDWCAEHFPQAIEQYVIAPAFEQADVIELVGTFFPNLVASRIRASNLTALTGRITETGGYLIDEDGGKAKVAAVSESKPSGAFAYRKAAGAAGTIMARWQSGELREIALGPLTLPGGTDD